MGYEGALQFTEIPKVPHLGEMGQGVLNRSGEVGIGEFEHASEDMMNYLNDWMSRVVERGRSTKELGIEFQKSMPEKVDLVDRVAQGSGLEGFHYQLFSEQIKNKIGDPTFRNEFLKAWGGLIGERAIGEALIKFGSRIDSDQLALLGLDATKLDEQGVDIVNIMARGDMRIAEDGIQEYDADLVGISAKCYTHMKEDVVVLDMLDPGDFQVAVEKKQKVQKGRKPAEVVQRDMDKQITQLKNSIDPFLQSGAKIEYDTVDGTRMRLVIKDFRYFQIELNRHKINPKSALVDSALVTDAVKDVYYQNANQI